MIILPLVGSRPGTIAAWSLLRTPWSSSGVSKSFLAAHVSSWVDNPSLVNPYWSSRTQRRKMPPLEVFPDTPFWPSKTSPSSLHSLDIGVVIPHHVPSYTVNMLDAKPQPQSSWTPSAWQGVNSLLVNIQWNGLGLLASYGL